MSYTREQVQGWKAHAIDHTGEGMNEMTPLMRLASTLAQRVEILANMVLSEPTPDREAGERDQAVDDAFADLNGPITIAWTEDGDTGFWYRDNEQGPAIAVGDGFTDALEQFEAVILRKGE